MEWTREKTLALINEYRKRRGLWDMTHDDYRKKEMKQKLLIEVSASLGGGIPIVEVEKKFHTLRTQYHREINRMKRKEPYNSKWFGFKNLQFLSSPKACRSNKSRVKAEITEDGTVTTKYILREPIDHNSTNISDEFLIHRKPRIYDNESRVNTTNASNSNTTGSQELEKLIEETTKEDTDDTKPKITIKEIAVTMEHHSYSNQMHGSNGELSGTEQDPLQHQEEHQAQDDHQMEEEDEPIETIDIQPVDEDGSYTATTVAGGTITHTHSVGNEQHQGMTRIIKIQRRDPADDYYEENNQQHSQQQPTSTINRHSGGLKRMYYDNNGQVQTPTLLNSTKMLNQSLPSPRTTQQLRDEFETYGEYVGNEMRNITNRQVLISLKHKINTALFEANMAELQK